LQKHLATTKYKTKQLGENFYSRYRFASIFKSHKSSLVTFQNCYYLYHLLPIQPIHTTFHIPSHRDQQPLSVSKLPYDHPNQQPLHFQTPS
jgi:hypothetical protein